MQVKQDQRKLWLLLKMRVVTYLALFLHQFEENPEKHSFSGGCSEMAGSVAGLLEVSN